MIYHQKYELLRKIEHKCYHTIPVTAIHQYEASPESWVRQPVQAGHRRIWTNFSDIDISPKLN